APPGRLPAPGRRRDDVQPRRLLPARGRDQIRVLSAGRLTRLGFCRKEPPVSMLASAAQGALPVPRAIKEHLLEPFIAAATLTLTEMAGTEVFARGVYRRTVATRLGDVCAVLGLTGT